ncbi:hypothetical protein QBC41DRAFT_318205 [Cercophora samala]|uniref:RxLR effector protein n=1 Tax=Cercophora samala TaxID=330535 RepID=A0AA39ZGI8_9PEZI|nr:hypothetical protein QBC41DRAFT_318205 [Cercophora samala]
MKFSPALLLLSATSPLALAIASPQDNPGVAAPSGSGTPILRRSNVDDTVVNARQRRALLRMRQEEAPTETVTSSTETVAATGTEAAPTATEAPTEGETGEGDVEVEVPDLANGTLPVNGTAPGNNGTEGGNGTANGTLSEQELKMKRMVKIRLPDYRRDEEVKERDAEAELGLTASIAKLLRW